jgi:RpiB/LacA/LacB family sugar-phosphate isomerase
MRIALASDHAGFPLKEEVKAVLQGQGLEVDDFGTSSEDACDLPDFVYPAALAVGAGEVDRGIFVDGVGYGSALIANRIAGVDAAVCQDPFCATLARSHWLGVGSRGGAGMDEHRVPRRRRQVPAARGQGAGDLRAAPQAVAAGVTARSSTGGEAAARPNWVWYRSA